MLQTVMRRLGLALFVLATVVAVIGMHSLGAGHTPAGHTPAGHTPAAHSSAGHAPVAHPMEHHAQGVAVEAVHLSAPVGQGDHGMTQMCLAILTLALALVMLARRARLRALATLLTSPWGRVAAPGRSPPGHLQPSLHRLCVSRT